MIPCLARRVEWGAPRERTLRSLAATRELEYGDTRIVLVEGEPIDSLRAALLVPVNARGVMASGFAGAVRLAAGGEVERELRAAGGQAPLLVGTAQRVGPARLADRGVEHVVCIVTTARPGDAPRRAAVEDALDAGFQALGSLRARSLTLPEIGTRIPGITLAEAAGVLIDSLAGHLRRGLALDEVVIAGLHREYLRACRTALESAGAVTVDP